MAQAERDNQDLVVLADDWGRLPSSCQHLIKRLHDDYRILWVSTIGTRRPTADCFTVHRVLEKLRAWTRGLQQVGRQMWTIDLPMLPGLSGHSLTINRWLATLVLRRAWRAFRKLQCCARHRLHRPCRDAPSQRRKSISVSA